MPDWLENYQDIGKRFDYTDAEIAEYGEHIRYVAKWLETNRARILGEPETQS